MPIVDQVTSPASGPRSLSVSGIESQLGFLQGEILTLAESSLPDKDQCKAFKDLARQFFRNRLRWIDQIASSPNDACSQNQAVNIT